MLDFISSSCFVVNVKVRGGCFTLRYVNRIHIIRQGTRRARACRLLASSRANLSALKRKLGSSIHFHLWFISFLLSVGRDFRHFSYSSSPELKVSKNQSLDM